MRAKLLHATLLGLIGAGIVHIVILFLLPDMSPRDAWSRLARQAETYQISTYAAGFGYFRPRRRGRYPLLPGRRLSFRSHRRRHPCSSERPRALLVCLRL